MLHMKSVKKNSAEAVAKLCPFLDFHSSNIQDPINKLSWEPYWLESWYLASSFGSKMLLNQLNFEQLPWIIKFLLFFFFYHHNLIYGELFQLRHTSYARYRIWILRSMPKQFSGKVFALLSELVSIPDHVRKEPFLKIKKTIYILYSNRMPYTMFLGSFFFFPTSIILVGRMFVKGQT